MTRMHFKADIAVLEFIVWFLINILFSNIAGNRSCRETLNTLHEIPHCPKDENEWKRRAYLKNCASVKQNCSSERHKFQYHCVLNENGDGTVEVCAPVWYLQGYCASYRTSISAIDNYYTAECSTFVNPCPDRFLSNESFKYQECYVLPEKQKHPLTTIKPVRENEKNEITKCSPSSEGSNLTLAITLGIGIPLIIVVGSILGIIIYFKCERYKSEDTGERYKSEDTDKTKCVPPSKTPDRSITNTDCIDGRPRMYVSTPSSESEWENEEEEERLLPFSNNFQRTTTDRLMKSEKTIGKNIDIPFADGTEQKNKEPEDQTTSIVPVAMVYPNYREKQDINEDRSILDSKIDLHLVHVQTETTPSAIQHS